VIHKNVFRRIFHSQIRLQKSLGRDSERNTKAAFPFVENETRGWHSHDLRRVEKVVRNGSILGEKGLSDFGDEIGHGSPIAKFHRSWDFLSN